MIVAIDLPPNFLPIHEEHCVEYVDVGPRFTSDGSFLFSLEKTSNAPDRPSLVPEIFPKSPVRVLEVQHIAADLREDEAITYKLAETKRLLGLSWEALASLIGCSRQALHKWSLGQPVSGPNREKVAKLHAAAKYIDRGSSEQNRALLEREHQGQILMELLAQWRFDEFRHVAGPGSGRQDANWGTVISPMASEEDHWYERLLASDPDQQELPRKEPQTFKRLVLRKG